MIGKKITANLLKALKNASVEKDVENAYRAAFENPFPGCISSPDRSDGVLRTDNITSLMEFKFDLDQRNSLERSGVIVQSLCYLKKMVNRGESLVKVLFIGDRNECFCIPTKDLIKYLSYDIDWNVAPNEAAKRNPVLVAEISEDKDTQPFIYDIDEKFSFQAVLEKMENISLNKPYAMDITENNIVEIFKVFEKDVMKDRQFKKGLDGKKISELVNLFYTCLTSPNDVYEHPKKENIIVYKNKEIRINLSSYYAFFSCFRQEYKPFELEKLTACKDRILEDVYRRRTGAFFTPQIWADEAHKMIAEQFGENWKEEYVVWDCAAGTANLTRGYKFKELYLSTLEQGDISIIKDCGYNPEATIFQYNFLSEINRNDFLSGSGIDKVPEGLRKAFEDGKKILFFINPPFGTAANHGESQKTGIAKNVVNRRMLQEKSGRSSSHLVAQFMYKIMSLKKLNSQISIAFFASPLYLTLKSFKKFRDKWGTNFQFSSGMLFQASHFADVKSQWGISFTIWKPGKVNDVNHKKVLLLKDVIDYKVKTIGMKKVYAANENVANEWMKGGIKKAHKKDMPPLMSAISYKQEQCKWSGGMLEGAIGCFLNESNNIGSNVTYVGLFSGAITIFSGGFIMPQNFRKVAALFTARKTIIPTWINCKDEYLIPNTNHPEYNQWNEDAIIYSLFNSSSQQSSLRNITYKDKKWDIKNEFFFMSNKEMRKLADDNSFNSMYQDTKAFSDDRYVYNLLKITSLSEDAQHVLNLARNLVRKSISIRKVYHDADPKYHLNAWDAGWAQLRPMLKQYYKEEYDEFVKVYKKFEDRMREGVYEFGFLKN